MEIDNDTKNFIKEICRMGCSPEHLEQYDQEEFTDNQIKVFLVPRGEDEKSNIEIDRDLLMAKFRIIKKSYNKEIYVPEDDDLNKLNNVQIQSLYGEIEKKCNSYIESRNLEILSMAKELLRQNNKTMGDLKIRDKLEEIENNDKEIDDDIEAILNETI